MKATWEQIFDFARGVATQEVREIVESDPQALAEVGRLSYLAAAKEEPAPELWVSRAKAILISEVPRASAFEGILSFIRPQLQPGYRSSNSLVAIAVAELGEDRIEVKITVIPGTDKLELIGIFESSKGRSLRIGSKDNWLGFADEDGQFIVQVASTVRSLLFHILETGETYILEIKYED